MKVKKNKMKKLLLLLLCVPLMFSCGENNEEKNEELSACDCADYAMKVVDLIEKGETELRDKIEKKYNHLTKEEKSNQQKVIEVEYETQRAHLRIDVENLKIKLEKENAICKDLKDESKNFLNSFNDCYHKKIKKYKESNRELNP